MREALASAWYDGSRWPLLLWPLSRIYAGIVALRRAAYRRGWLAQHQIGIPVIVIGNITVGGTGKTPLVAWLVKHLQAQGRSPGIVSRGYRGKASQWPQWVTGDSDPVMVGDEPVMLARATGVPVAAAPRRPEAARLLRDRGVDIIVADDGLQHYALARDLEIAVRDGARGYGNRHLLPAGPLREPMQRLNEVDIELVHGLRGSRNAGFELRPDSIRGVRDPRSHRALADFAGRRVHAVAGIGHPQRFFRLLEDAGIEVIEHPLPDHHEFSPADIHFNDGYDVLMTEKDAIKCRAFATDNHWYVAVSARLDEQAVEHLNSLVSGLISGDPEQ